MVNSQIVDNGTNVGIGTASPGAKLDVNGGVNATRYTIANDSNISFLNTPIDAAALIGGSNILGDGMQQDLLAFNPPTTQEYWN